MSATFLVHQDQVRKILQHSGAAGNFFKIHTDAHTDPQLLVWFGCPNIPVCLRRWPCWKDYNPGDWLASTDRLLTDLLAGLRKVNTFKPFALSTSWRILPSLADGRSMASQSQWASLIHMLSYTNITDVSGQFMSLSTLARKVWVSFPKNVAMQPCYRPHTVTVRFTDAARPSGARTPTPGPLRATSPYRPFGCPDGHIKRGFQCVFFLSGKAKDEAIKVLAECTQTLSLSRTTRQRPTA